MYSEIRLKVPSHAQHKAGGCWGLKKGIDTLPEVKPTADSMNAFQYTVTESSECVPPIYSPLLLFKQGIQHPFCRSRLAKEPLAALVLHTYLI